MRANCVCPGLIDTSMADWIRLEPDVLHAWERTIPAGRIGSAHDVAGAIAYLASGDADYLHGTVMVVDGGATV